MNILDRQFKDLLQDEINERFLEAQTNLAMPITKEFASDLHEIGSIRGYMRACKELYEVCDEIQKKLNEPEKRV